MLNNMNEMDKTLEKIFRDQDKRRETKFKQLRKRK